VHESWRNVCFALTCLVFVCLVFIPNFARAATLTSIQVAPSSTAIAAGTTRQLTATGTYSDGSKKTITDSVIWSSTNTAVATISGFGLATGKAVGSVTIKAASGSISGTAILQVTAPILRSITVTPGSASLFTGQTRQFVATGTYSDGSTAVITNSVSWTSSKQSVATISGTGLANAIANGRTTIKATSGAVAGNATLSVNTPQLDSVALSPINPSAPQGATIQFTATGRYSDGSTRDLTNSLTWTSSNTAVATINSSGLAATVTVGTTDITANANGVNAQTSLTVTAQVLASIAVTPANSSIPLGTTEQLTATGKYSDGSTRDLTSAVTWSSTSTSTATIGSSGLATSHAVGMTTVAATLGTVSDQTNLTVSAAALVSIAVTPTSPSLPVGDTQQFTAMGTYTDGTTQNISTVVTWASSAPSVATIGSTGLAATEGDGSTIISASSGPITSNSASLTVLPAVLQSIAVAPASSSMAKGTTQQFTATGTYSDGSTQNLAATVTWSSDATAVAGISASGLATAVAVGSANITAKSGAITGSTLVTVTPAQLISIAVTPAIPTIALGTTDQLTATGTYTDNTTQDLTATVRWTSSNGDIATISNSAGSYGLASGVATGQTIITATSDAITGHTTLTVSAAELLLIAVTPANPSIVLGTTEQFTATGTYTDSSTKDLTSTAVWSSDTTTTATIDSTGLAHSIGSGTARITAAVGAVSEMTTITVTPAALMSIAVTPSSPSIPLGTTQAFTATGNYADGSTQDLTSSVHWSTSDGTVATISNASGTYGVASSVAVGSVTITAASGGISGTAQLSITPAALVSISVTPANPTIALGQSQQFTATGTYTDKSTKDITTNVTWSSSSAMVAVISNNTGSMGLATSSGTGSVTITATLGAVFGTTGMTVRLSQLVSIAVTPTNSSIAAGKTQQFTATGTYTDNSTADLTSAVVWASTNTTVATISSGGNVTGISQGGTTITATSGSVVGNTSLTVSAPVLTGVTVTPANPSVSLGLTAQFTAIAVYSDTSTQNVTNSANWTSSNNSVSTVSITGLASTLAQGATIIGASFGGQSGSTTLTVGPPALVSIAVTPNPATVSAGSSVQFTAMGTYTNQSAANISSLATWTSTNTSVSTVNGTGLAQSANAGTATITATLGAVQGTASLTVTSAAPPAVAYIGVHGTCAAKNNLGCTISGLNMSTANFIVMSISDYGESGTGGTPSDSQNNLWYGPYLECSSAGPCTVNTKIYFCVNCSVSSSQTFTWTSSGDYPSLTVEGFSGMPPYSPFSQWVKATNIGSSLSTGSLTPNTNGQLCITTLAQGTNGGTPAVSPLNPFYLTDVQANVSNLVGYGMAYEIQTTAAALSATWSGFGSGPTSALLACFLPKLGQPVYDWYQDNENSTDGTAITATIVQNGRHVADPNMASSGIVIGSGGTAKISTICQHPETTSKNVGGTGYNSSSGTRGLLLQTTSGTTAAGWNYGIPTANGTVLSGGNSMEESYWEWPGLSSTDTTGYYSMGSPSNPGGDFMGNMHHAGKHYIEAGANPNGKADSCTGICDANGFYTLVRDTSTTSNTIGTGSNLTFTTSASDGWAAGTSLIITNSLATMANAVSGTVVSDTGTTLVFHPTIAVGSGTYSSWTIIPWNYVKMQYNGYKVLGTGTSSCTVATGSCTITTASALGLSAGTVVSYFNTTTKGVSGTVTSDSGTTLVMNIVNIYGSGSLTSGNISTSAHELIIEDSLGNLLSTQYKIANPAQPGAPNQFGSGFGGDGGVAGSSFCHDGETVHWIGASEFSSLVP